MSKRTQLLDDVLECAALELGDITAPVISLLYKRFPAAKENFKEHGFDNVADLETSMVESALYIIMTWYERPREIEILLEDAVPHHLNVLNTPMSIFVGLVESVIDILASTVPRERCEMRQECVALKAELVGLINRLNRA